jgi:SAM-dependent methyltransferase
LKAGVLASVLANSVLNAVRADVDRAILEVYRVLADQGLFVLTVPTTWIDQTYLVSKILRKVGASQLAIRHLAKLNRRLDHHQISDEEGWLKRREDAHFHVEQVRYYITPRQAFWVSILTLQVFRVFAFLKILRVHWIRQKAAHIQEKIFRPIFVKEQSLVQLRKRDQAGYLLIVARKVSVGANQGPKV